MLTGPISKSRSDLDNPNLTFNPQINEHSRRLASARRSCSRISEAFGRATSAVAPPASPERHAVPDDERETDGPVGDGAAAARPGDGREENPHVPLAFAEPSAGAFPPSDPRRRLPPLGRQKYSFDSQLTFAPQINANSMRILAKSNKGRAGFVERLSTQRAIDVSKIVKPFTFMPQISKRSAEMAEKLSSTFLSRQQAIVEKRNQCVPADTCKWTSPTKRRKEAAAAAEAAGCGSSSSPRKQEAMHKLGSMTIAAANLPVKLSVARKLAFSRHAAKGINEETTSGVISTATASSSAASAATAAASAATAAAAAAARSTTASTATSSIYHRAVQDARTANKSSAEKLKKALAAASLKSRTIRAKNKADDDSDMTIKIGRSGNRLMMQLSIAEDDTDGTAKKSTMAMGTQAAADDSEGEDETPDDGTAASKDCVEDAGDDADGDEDDCLDSDADGDGDGKTGDAKQRQTHLPKRQRKIFLPKHMDIDRVRRVKARAAQATKQKRIFSIYGPYPMVRYALRRRGWIEHEYKVRKGILARKKKQKPKPKPSTLAVANSKATTGGGNDDRVKKSQAQSEADSGNDDSDDQDDQDGMDEDEPEPCPRLMGYEPMTKTEDDEWGMLSRAVRNAYPHFVWTMMKEDIDFKMLQKDQYVNHFREGHAFTTKVGICKNLRQLSWSCQQCADDFFPRCYVLSSEEDRAEFVDNYRLTAAVAIIKSFNAGKNSADRRWNPGNYFKQRPRTAVQKRKPSTDTSCSSEPSSTDTTPDSSPTVPRKKNAKQRKPGQQRRLKRANGNGNGGSKTSLHSTTSKASLLSSSSSSTHSLPPVVGPGTADGERPQAQERALRLAVEACELFLRDKEHEHIDEKKVSGLSDEEWAYVISQFYLICHYNAQLDGVSAEIEQRAAYVLHQLEQTMPQSSLDGIRNIWIVKPGAKSRGRGIVCMDRLDNILPLVDGITGMKESKWVVQKYIERPLLIHGTKFDIRQWFLVTDWNPLTLWFYKASYLRFCGKQFTLLDLSAAVHLANNAVQRHLDIDTGRSAELPDDNMWSSDQFKEYLKQINRADEWKRIYKGMKDAITGTLLSMQDIVECRKNSFELFGADFMLTEDYRPWLIEINCSPALSATTHVTGRLCAAVIEDTVKVVLDRRRDKKADTGDFELAFKRPAISMPSYVGSQLSVEGHRMKISRMRANKTDEADE